MPADADLNAREIQILDAMSAGQTAPDIAKRLGVTVSTVQTYQKRLKEKLGAVNAPHAVRIGFEQGYLERERVASC